MTHSISDRAREFSLSQIDAERFWSRVKQTPSGCWEWQGALSGPGYGAFCVGGSRYPAHRVALADKGGSLPHRSIAACHSCDNPPCVRPDHLFWGTAQDNLKDASAKGRLANNRKTSCPQGHPYDAINTYFDKKGERYCRECHRHHLRKARRLRKEAKRQGASHG